MARFLALLFGLAALVAMLQSPLHAEPADIDAAARGVVRVVIIGQDPYHGPGQAHGLCFSVLRGVQTPPSLKNIYKELADDVEGFQVPSHGNLQSWADQGVFLLNATLTVRKGDANSHQKLGWQERCAAVSPSPSPEH